MSSELVKALKAWDAYEPNISEEKVLMQAVAVIDASRPLLARIEALEADKARLREVLEPFAKAADNFDEFKINNDAEWFAYSGIQRATGSVGAITVADLRAARRAREGGNADG